VELSFKYQTNGDGYYIPLPVLARWQHLINELNERVTEFSFVMVLLYLVYMVWKLS
jgi:hypothetical protein